MDGAGLATARTASSGMPAPAFACDAMLGGLARWLRAAGYDASFHPGIDDAELVRLAHEQRRILLSCDAGIFQRAEVAASEPRAIRLEPNRSPVAQLTHVLRTLGLGLGQPRCIACGGMLRDATAAEIAGAPERTRAITQRFWMCTGCGRLLWRGAHWRRIERGLAEAVG